MKPEILLIGGAGFLGTALARRLIASDWRVGILDRSSPFQSNGVTEYIGEIRDLSLLRRALQDFKRVVFLAHEFRTAPATDRLPANFLNNIELFLKVLEECREADTREFTLLSTGGAVYGNPVELPIAENHPLEPKSLYGVAKLTMEKILSIFAEQNSIRYLAVRPSNPYGPGQNFNGPQGLVAVAMAKIARGETLAVRGDGKTIKDFLYIDDFAEAFLKLLVHPEATGVYNIGSGQGLEITSVISHIEATLGKTAKIEFEQPQTGDVTGNVLDFSKIKDCTGWFPSTAFPQGLEKTWLWMKSKL